MIRCLTREKRGKRGFTMMEVLVVVGIIAVIAAIAIPSVISMRKNMDYKQRCDYAKTIFLAAQSNLADLRSTGELDQLKENKESAVSQDGDNEEGSSLSIDFPNDDFSTRYVYTYHDPKLNSLLGTPAAVFDTVLPVNSVESAIRDQQIIIEYNPRTGGVYAVFYAEDYANLAEIYRNGHLQRNETWLKNNAVGYYNGSDLTGEELGFYELAPILSFENGQEAILNIDIPKQYTGDGVIDLIESGRNAEYIQNMEIYLTVIGENSGMFTKQLKKSGQTAEDAGLSFTPGSGVGAVDVLKVPVVLDSLMAGKGLLYAEENKKGINPDNTIEYHVKPGDNISVALEITYAPEKANDKLIIFDDAVLAGINPLFHSVTGEAPNCTVAIANGRHLQNLNSMDVSVAGGVNTITFVRADAQTEKSPEINWKDTVNYYWETYKNQNVSYFAPIDHQQLVKTEVDGKYAVISNLDISSDGVSKSYVNYAKPVSNATEVGLFRTINGSVHDLRIVNPVIQGNADTKAVGALAGSAGTEAVIHNCYVYVDTDEKYFSWDNLDISDNFKGGNTKYGVSGYTAVGGMVGYSNDADFTNSLASVPVYGNMNTAGTTVGVGGFVGAAKDGSFTKCYTGVRTLGSGAVFANQNAPASCGLGGFVGTSDNAYYTNCFASGHVTNTSNGANTRAATGGFVGIANSSKTALFNACYALGTVRATDGSGIQQAKFVGESISAINAERQDYYKALLKNSTSSYIFRDCYYLQGKTGVLNADNYTLPASFDMLYSLYNINSADLNHDYSQYIFSSFHAQGVTLTNDQIKTIVGKFNDSGFAKDPHEWTQGLASEGNGHHPYNENFKKNGANYPYSMLTNMPFYGIWPDAPSDVRIAYVEIYHDGSLEVYYNEGDIDKVPLDKAVIADGYVIMSANGGRSYEVTFNGASDGIQIPLIFAYTETDSKNEYYYGFIPVNQVPVSESFYTEVEMNGSQLIKNNDNEYRMYFNPYVALSQKNPTKPNTKASAPGTPETSYIHSARQLNALATKMSAFWDLDYNLIGTVDFDRYGLGDTELAKYGFDSKTVGNYGIIKYDLASIGTEANPFTGKLTGAYNATVKVQGTAATVGAKTGLIGVLGANGQVSGITITGTMELGNNEGALVNVMNGGILENCAVNAVITSNSKTAGLVVGALNGGKISDCTFDNTGVDPDKETSTHLGFVGVAKMTGYVDVDAKAKYFTKTEFKESSIAESKIESTFTKITDAETAKKRAYAGKIDEDCFFTVNGKTTPAVETEIYYYSISEDEEYKKSDTPATEFVAVSSVKPSEFGTGNTQWKSTGYYFMRDNKYYPVSVIVTAVEKPVSQPSVVADTDGTDSDESTDPTQESTGATEPPAPQTKTVYTYAFGYNNETWYTTSEIEDPETPITLPADLPLYRLNMPVKGKTYILVNLTGGALKADGNSQVVQKNSDITEDMVWTVSADGVWFNNKETEKKITVTLGNVANGAEQHPMMKVGNIDYNVYAVSENTERNVELVDRDCEYVTTESLASKPETT